MPCIHPFSGQKLCIQAGLSLGNGNPLIIYHLNLTLILLRQDHGALTGAGQAAAHGNVHNFITLLQQRIPEFHDRLRAGLACPDIRPRRQLIIEFLLGQVNILIECLLVNHKRHGQHMDSQFPSRFLGDTAVAVRNNCYLRHNFLLHINNR